MLSPQMSVEIYVSSLKSKSQDTASLNDAYTNTLSYI